MFLYKLIHKSLCLIDSKANGFTMTIPTNYLVLFKDQRNIAFYAGSLDLSKFNFNFNYNVLLAASESVRHYFKNHLHKHVTVSYRENKISRIYNTFSHRTYESFLSKIEHDNDIVLDVGHILITELSTIYKKALYAADAVPAIDDAVYWHRNFKSIR